MEERWFDGLVARTARSWNVALLVAVAIATAASAVHMDRYPELQRVRQEAAQQDLRRPGDATTTGALAGGAGDVGPAVGVDLQRYVADRRDALAALDEDERRLAVVSFDGYLTGEQAEALLPGSVQVRLVQYRVPVDGAQPLESEVVGGELAASVERALAAELPAIAAEEAELRTLLDSGTLQDEEMVADHEARLSELQALRNLLASGAPVVFAVVVEGPVGALRELAAGEGIRLVDVAPSGAELDGSAFFGVRPEDDRRASYGRSG